MKKQLLFLVISFMVPLAPFLLVYFLPFEYSQLVIQVVTYPLAAFDFDAEIYKSWSFVLFGRHFPNNAPIQMLILFTLYFCSTLVVLNLWRYLSNKKAS